MLNKKIKSKVVLLLLTAFICITITACNNSDDASKALITGTWELSSAKVADQEITRDDFLKQMNLDSFPQIIFYEDNTVSIEIFGEAKKSKWSDDGDGVYTIKDSDNSSDLQVNLENNQLLFSQSGITLVFEKQKSAD
ncbi:hypothetical protein NIA71_03430 [Ihubacter massiliensis]|uniref:Lipocalin-like domain-containing protein n=1 Tax=Hominibacterium faecale TaxID=2839743 RepID=A0A9J6QRA1_9FIRM|nr:MULTISPECIES: hypothetical protein [Eubacteriales Family XIII. Incertae Sedis]MCO7121000.1 hypothetical protein [Ihubacter massiliensis]MCU7377916.1 hypothetical protein [Hominibacterium faecale]